MNTLILCRQGHRFPIRLKQCRKIENNKLITVKTVITPRKKTFSLTIPEDYVGKTLEILFYSIDEIADKKEPANKKLSDFFGTLTGQEGEKFQAYVNQSREEWNRNI